jgi:hypothetical protein
MRNVYKALGLLLLLLTAQQGAVNHELSHFSNAGRLEMRVNVAGVVDTTCTLCPAFAQAATAAFSHSLQIPLLARVASQLIPEPRHAVVDSAVPRPRSRGPPSLS